MRFNGGATLPPDSNPATGDAVDHEKNGAVGNRTPVPDSLRVASTRVFDHLISVAKSTIDNLLCNPAPDFLIPAPGGAVREPARCLRFAAHRASATNRHSHLGRESV